MLKQNKLNIKFPFLEFLITCCLGVIFHFIFAWSGGNTIIGAIAPVNESTWEHMKLVLFPALFVSIAAYLIYGKADAGFVPSRIIGILIGTLSIPFFYYFVRGAFGEPSAIINISIYIISVLIAYFLYTIPLLHADYFASDHATVVWGLILTGAIVLFIYFTFETPMIEIFRDPLSLDFGIINP